MTKNNCPRSQFSFSTTSPPQPRTTSKEQNCFSSWYSFKSTREGHPRIWHIFIIPHMVYLVSTHTVDESVLFLPCPKCTMQIITLNTLTKQAQEKASWFWRLGLGYKIMVKVTLSLSMPRRYLGGTEVQLHSFLTSVLHGDELSTHAPPTLDIFEKRKISCHCCDSNPRPSSPHPRHCTNYFYINW